MKSGLKSIFKSLKEKKSLIENFSFVAILQFFQLFVAFISYPYLIRILGKETYGLVIFAQTIINYFVIIINFGFKTIITYEIAANIKSVSKVSRIVSSTYIAKIIFTITSFLVLAILIILIPRFRDYYLLYIFSFLFCFGELLLPVWFFQAIEKMKYITIINVIVKSVFLLLIFVFVKGETDYLLVPLFLGLGSILGGFSGVVLMYTTRLTKEKQKITFILPTFSDITWVMKRSFSYFLSNIAATVKGKTSNIFLGIFLNYESVAIYDICFKVINILNTIFSVFSTVLFPRLVKSKSIPQIRKVFRILFSFGIIMFLGVFFGAKPIIYVLGGDNLPEITKNILRIMAITLPFSGGIVGLGGLTLVSLKKDKHFTYGIVLTLLFYLCAVAVLLIFNIFTITNIAIVYLLCIVFEFGVHRFNVRRLKFY